MTRERILEIIHDPALLPDEGSAAREAFRAGLRADAELAAMHDGQRMLREALDAWEDVEPSADFDRAVIDRVEGASPWWSRWLAWAPAGRPLVAAAALAAIACFALLVWNREASAPPVVVTAGQPAPAVEMSPVETAPAQPDMPEVAPAPAEVVAENDPPEGADIDLGDADLDQLDAALDDLEMLADFELLAFAEEPAD